MSVTLMETSSKLISRTLSLVPGMVAALPIVRPHPGPLPSLRGGRGGERGRPRLLPPLPCVSMGEGWGEGSPADADPIGRSTSPSTPSALSRRIRSLGVRPVMPARRVTSSRLIPSGAPASASGRVLTRPRHPRRADARSSARSSSGRRSSRIGTATSLVPPPRRSPTLPAPERLPPGRGAADGSQARVAGTRDPSCRGRPP